MVQLLEMFKKGGMNMADMSEVAGCGVTTIWRALHEPYKVSDTTFNHIIDDLNAFVDEHSHRWLS